jgi:hypothetical protein
MEGSSMKRTVALIIALALFATLPGLTALAQQQPLPQPTATTSSLLAAPSLRSPDDGAQLPTMGPIMLSWSLPSGASQYQVQVIPLNSDGPGINLVIGDPVMVNSQSYLIPAPVLGQGNYIMLPGATYIWRVRATTSFDQMIEADVRWGDWSTSMMFKTPAASSSSISLSSVGSANVSTSSTPTLLWTDQNSNNFYYEVQLSRDSRFNTDRASATEMVYWNLVHGGQSVPMNTWTVPANFPLVAGTYFWRVRPRVQATLKGTSEGGVAWSATGSFIKQ